MQTTKYISDVISINEIENWKTNENILINSGTGTGKTYFIVNVLNQYAQKENKKILLLEPRTILKKQQKILACGCACKNIDVLSYQQIEQNDISMNKYDYVVLDEAHYLFSDAGFNDFTNESYSKIIKLECVKIWISATCDDVVDFFTRKSIAYKTYNVSNDRIVSNLYMIEDDEIANIIELAVHHNRKMLVVINDTDKLTKLYRKYEKNSSIVLGTANQKNKRMRKIIDAEVKYLAENETFSKNILFATCAIDCGTNIKDYNFSEIIIDGIYDIAQIKQIVGRKRKLYDGDTITLFVKNIKNSTLNGYNTALKRNIKCAEYFLEYGQSAYIKWRRSAGNRFKDKYDILYDVETEEGYMMKAVNEMKLLFFKNTIKRTTDMIRTNKKGLQYVIEKTFDVTAQSWEVDATPVIEDILKGYYESGMMWWNKEESRALAIELGFKDKYNRPITSYKAINSALKHELNSEYRIFVSRKRKMVDGVSTIFASVWHIEKI